MGSLHRSCSLTLALSLAAQLPAAVALAPRARADAPAAYGANDPTPIAPEALSPLADAQRALVEARALAAQLDEHAALARLLSAERALRLNLHVPGAHAWLAELWLQMGLVAAQRGEVGLADTLLGRALVLDPSRHLGAAEAAPPSVARYQAMARARDAAPRSRFRLDPSPESASCWIDGRLQAAGASEVELTPGPHLVLIEAPGYRSHAELIDALPGNRRPLAITLSATPDTDARRVALGLQRAAAAHSADAPPRVAQARAQPQPKRWWRRWPVWASAAAAATASAIALGLAARDEPSVQQRSLRIDPGPSEP